MRASEIVWLAAVLFLISCLGFVTVKHVRLLDEIERNGALPVRLEEPKPDTMLLPLNNEKLPEPVLQPSGRKEHAK